MCFTLPANSYYTQHLELHDQRKEQTCLERSTPVPLDNKGFADSLQERRYRLLSVWLILLDNDVMKDEFCSQPLFYLSINLHAGINARATLIGCFPWQQITLGGQLPILKVSLVQLGGVTLVVLSIKLPILQIETVLMQRQHSQAQRSV